MSQLAEVQALLGAARVVLEQAYTLTTQCAAEALIEDDGLGYPKLFAQANEALEDADRGLTAVGRERAAHGIAPLFVLDCGRPDWVYVCGQPVPLRPAEFRLLAALCRSPRKVVPYDALYNALWDGETFVEPGLIYAPVSRLRKKLSDCWPPELPELIATVKLVGAVLQVPVGRLAFAPEGGDDDDERGSACDAAGGDCESADEGAPGRQLTGGAA